MTIVTMTTTKHKPQALTIVKARSIQVADLGFCASVFEKAAKSGPRVFKVRVQGQPVPQSPRDDATDTGNRGFLQFHWRLIPFSDGKKKPSTPTCNRSVLFGLRFPDHWIYKQVLFQVNGVTVHEEQEAYQ